MAKRRPKYECPIQKRHCSICGRQRTHVLDSTGTWRCMEEATHRYNRDNPDEEDTTWNTPTTSGSGSGS